jgi:hypothetical protein
MNKAKNKTTSSKQDKEKYSSFIHSCLFTFGWMAAVIFLTHNDFTYRLLSSFGVNDASLLIAALLLIPIGVVLFPQIYRIDGIYNINLKSSPKNHSIIRVIFSAFALGCALWLLWYLFTVISVALYLNGFIEH